MHSMALKVNISPEDRKVIDQLLETAGVSSQHKKFHCTIGFIEKMIPDHEAHTFGEKMTNELQAFVNTHPLTYEVEKIEHLFHHIIAFLPTQKTLLDLRKANLWLYEKVKDMSNQRWTLNPETVPENYFPHMTLWRTSHSDKRTKTLQDLMKIPLILHLTEAEYVLL